MVCIYFINTLKLFWPILGQRKTSLVVFFMKKENEFSCLFGQNIFSNGLYQVIRNNIVAKKTAELVFLFHEKDNRASFPLA